MVKNWLLPFFFESWISIKEYGVFKKTKKKQIRNTVYYTNRLINYRSRGYISRFHSLVHTCVQLVEVVNCTWQNKRAGRWFPISVAVDAKSTSILVPVSVTMHLCALHPRYHRLRFLYGHPRWVATTIIVDPVRPTLSP